MMFDFLPSPTITKLATVGTIDGSEVSLASLAILGTIVAALIWLLKKLFNQNDTTLKEYNQSTMKLGTAIDGLTKILAQNDSDRREFQECVVKSLSKISKVQDTINDRQITLYKKVETEILEDNGSTTHTVTDTKVIKN